MWVRNYITLGTKWHDLGTKWYGLGYEMAWDESVWVRNDVIPFYVHDMYVSDNRTYNKKPTTCHHNNISFTFTHLQMDLYIRLCPQILP